tara:strand:+ start:525 stop:1022 length:498 start_codon:yes stop_codon:yes gene_type:complete
MLENQANIVYLSIGSNLGNRVNNIEKAKSKLIEKGIEILSASSYYETFSWPDKNKPKFYNIVLKIKTTFNEIKLLKICKEIEKFLGRKKMPINSPRECDIDIIDFSNKFSEQFINLPHPRMHTRNFVLIPLFEINRNWKHPVIRQNIKTLIFSLSNRDITSIKQI